MKNRFLSCGCAAVMALVIGSLSRAEGAEPPVTQPATRPTTVPSTSAREILGVILEVDTKKRTVKLALWDRGLKQNASGKYPAVIIHWTEDTVVVGEAREKMKDIIGGASKELKSAGDLVGWRAGLSVTPSNAGLQTADVQLYALLPGDSIPALVGSSGATVVGRVTGAIPATRVKEIDEQSEVEK